jgi:hypothetical protein
MIALTDRVTFFPRMSAPGPRSGGRAKQVELNGTSAAFKSLGDATFTSWAVVKSRSAVRRHVFLQPTLDQLRQLRVSQRQRAHDERTLQSIDGLTDVEPFPKPHPIGESATDGPTQAWANSRRPRSPVLAINRAQ